MGIQINGNTDIISATDGSLTIQGASGNLTGNLTGTATTAQGLTGTPNITVGTIGATSLNASGVVTATSFSGSLTGNVTGNINSSGVSTLGNTVVGGGTTQLVVTGNARITGILTIGTSSITLDGSNNQVNVGTGVTLHHTNGVQVGGNTLHSTVLTVNQINASGVVTATSFSGSGANLTGIAATTDVRTNSLVVIGVSTVAAGSTAAPSITPTGDSNTGIFFPAADTIAFGEGGSEAARIDSSGRFGLGTASPTQDLEIARGAGASAYVSLRGNNETAANGFYIGQDSSGLARLFQDGNKAITFWTGSAASERARIDSSGRLLLGTSSARSNIYFGGNNYTPKLQLEDGNTYGNGPSVITYSASNYPATFTFGTSLNNTPGSNTAIPGGNYDLSVINFTGNDGTNFRTAATIEVKSAGTFTSSSSPGSLVFKTTAIGSQSPTEHMRINQQGAVQMSTNGSYSSPAQDHSMEQHANDRNIAFFYHNGGVGVNPYGISVFFINQSPNSTGAYFIECRDSVGYKAYMRSNGGLSNYQANNTNLCDEREKKNIENLESTWDCLKNWELKKFNYIEDSNTEDKRYGVIAQQIEEHCPEVISDWVKQKAEPAKLDDDGNELEPAKEEIVRMGVKEQQMYWMAIKALQEAQVRIESLEAEVAALKA